MFSTVFLCRHDTTGELFACKKFTRAKMTRTSLKNLHEEIKILSNLPQECGHIIRLKDTIKTANHFYIIIDYCNGGDLEELLESRGVLKEQEAQVIFAQVIKAMKVLRDLRVVHRDIKNANILLHFPPQLQDGKFGRSAPAHRCLVSNHSIIG